MQTRPGIFVFCVLALAGCQTKRFEHAAHGQLSMHDLAQHRSAKSLEVTKHQAAIRERAKSLSAERAELLLASLKAQPADRDLYTTLFQHYQMAGDTASLYALQLWYIEHQPEGSMWTGNIDSHIDRKAYERGRALWLAHVRRPGAAPVAFERAAQFLESGDRSLAEAVLRAGMKAYPQDARWTRELGTHYAQALAGTGEPFTEFNVVRVVNAGESQTPYAQSVRERLAASTDATLLVETSQCLLRLRGLKTSAASLALAREYVTRAERLNPNLVSQTGIKQWLDNAGVDQRLRRIINLSLDEKAKLGDNDQLLLTFVALRKNWVNQRTDEAGAEARKAIELATRLPDDPMRNTALFEANMTLGKIAFRNGDRQSALRYLLAVADLPPAGPFGLGEHDFNLARALIDAGHRTAVAQYFERIAPRSRDRAKLETWAAQIRRGINPDDMPFFSSMGCAHDPC